MLPLRIGLTLWLRSSFARARLFSRSPRWSEVPEEVVETDYEETSSTHSVTPAPEQQVAPLVSEFEKFDWQTLRSRAITKLLSLHMTSRRCMLRAT